LQSSAKTVALAVLKHQVTVDIATGDPPSTESVNATIVVS